MAKRRGTKEKRRARTAARAKPSAGALAKLARKAQGNLEANARRGRVLLRTIAAKIDSIERSFYEIGVALQELRSPAIWGALGAESFEALVATIPQFHLALAYRLLRIADHYRRRTALTLGQHKALALVAYAEATPVDDDAETLARKDARIGGRRISEHSVRGIVEAAVEARPEVARRVRPGEKEGRAAAADLERRLEAASEDAVSVRLIHRKGAFRAIVDMPIALAHAITVSPQRTKRRARR